MNQRSPSFRSWLALGLALGTLASASAGTFKRITVDGSFADWAGVPVAATDDEGDLVAGTLGGFDLREIYVANDDQYLYVRVAIHSSSATPTYNQFHHHFFVDSDNDPSTGRGAYGIGIEMLIEDAGGYSERYGTFNDGQLTGLDWAQAPSGVLPTYQYEARISRAVRDTQPADVPVGSGNPERDLPVFTQDAIAIAWEVQDSNWAVQDTGTPFGYEMAPLPPPFTGTQTLVNLTTTPWRANDAGIDLGSDWLAADYDDTQTDWKQGPGLFGYNAPGGVYPAPIATTLAGGRSAYYLRTHFNWTSDQKGAGVLVTSYLSAGAVFYLNGAEVKRIRMPAGAIAHSTPATGGPAQPGTADVFDMPTSALVVGDNVLQVEVHPATGATSSLVFGLSLTASDNFPPRLEDPTQPADRTVTEGEATTFSVGTVAGTAPFTYQWYKDGALIAGATGITHTVDPVTENDAGDYSVEITNPKGLTVTSRAAKLTTTAVPVVITDPGLPADLTVAEGAAATFTVSATGTLLTYQWYRENDPLDGEVGQQLTLNNVPISENGKQYWVVVSNRLGDVPSRKATLLVVRDSTAPWIERAAGGGRSVVVTFSEPLDPTSAEKAANYTLDGGLQVQSAALDSGDGRTVTLATTQQTFGQAYRLTATGVHDRFGNGAATTAPFRSTIVIDGGFDDWATVPVLLTQEESNPGSVEFKELSIANDNDYLYLRFSFYVPVGPLGPALWSDRGHHYDIVFDTDQDPSTGTWSGGDVLIEDGGVYRLAGGWTQGIYVDHDVAIAPGEPKATDFELRISLQAKHQTDGLKAFPNSAINCFIVIQSTGWAALDRTDPQVPYTLVSFPPLAVTPGPLSVRLVGGQVELTWPGTGALEARTSLPTGNWETVPGAVSGLRINPAAAAASYYRLRQD